MLGVSNDEEAAFPHMQASATGGTVDRLAKSRSDRPSAQLLLFDLVAGSHESSTTPLVTFVVWGARGHPLCLPRLHDLFLT